MIETYSAAQLTVANVYGKQLSPTMNQADHRWMRTAVSQCSTLEIALAIPSRIVPAPINTAGRIEGHRHGFAIDKQVDALGDMKYVT